MRRPNWIQSATSGSTGPPKAFRLSDDEVTARALSRSAAKGEAFNQIASLFCDLPALSTAFLAYERWAQLTGVAFFAPQDPRVQRAIDVFSSDQAAIIPSLARHVQWAAQARRRYPAAATIEAALQLCAAERVEGIVSRPTELLDYAATKHDYRFAFVLGTGGPAAAEQSAAIRAGLGENLWFSYGASEVGSIALATAAQVEAIPGCAGALCPGVQVEIDNDGRLRVKTATMIAGYDDPAATAQYFRDGWFYPGDVGHWTDDGLLVLGRRRL
jgi:long-subunit acyl-CoA synthetase (AMP-forming)